MITIFKRVEMGPIILFLEDNYDWIGIKKDIELYLKNCVTCAKLKNIEKTKRDLLVNFVIHIY